MSKLQPFAKAIVPAFLTLLATLAQSFINGSFDRTSATIAAVGLIGAAVTYFVPNAASEVQAAEAVFSPIAAGHPDPEPPAVALVPPAAPETPVAAPAVPPAIPPAA